MRYQSDRPRRQFLAGVACPKCHAMDSIVQVRLFGDAPDEYIECIQCNHQERRPKAEDIVLSDKTSDTLATDASVVEVSTTGTQGKVRFLD